MMLASAWGETLILADLMRSTNVLLSSRTGMMLLPVGRISPVSDSMCAAAVSENRKRMLCICAATGGACLVGVGVGAALGAAELGGAVGAVALSPLGPAGCTGG